MLLYCLRTTLLLLLVFTAASLSLALSSVGARDRDNGQVPNQRPTTTSIKGTSLIRRRTATGEPQPTSDLNDGALNTHLAYRRGRMDNSSRHGASGEVDAADAAADKTLAATTQMANET
ncbi:hypothetical protein VaNZ11_001673, partial [Volvox africanus]